MKILLSILNIVVLVYLGFGALLWLLQERLVFLPNVSGRALTATPEDVGFAYEDVEFMAEDGVRLHGWHVPAPESRGTVLFFHGNAGNISHRLTSIALFRRLGLNTFIVDYRGYGQSAGKPSEAGIYRDATAAWRYLVEERAVPGGSIVIFGRSIGGAPAAALATQVSPAALIVESSMTSARDLARQIYPIYPTSLILRLRLPVLSYVTQASCPVLIVHARDDEIIPFAMGESLFAAASEPKAFLAIDGDHNSAFITDLARYARGLKMFLDTHLPVVANAGG